MHRSLPPRPPRRLPIKPALAILAGLFVVTILSAAGDDAPAPAATKPVFEEWVVVVINGKTSGYGSTITTKVGTPSGPGYLTVHHEEFLVKRESADMKISVTSKVTEDADGGVLSFDQVSDSGAAVETKGVREGDEMVVSSRGQTQRFKLPRLDALGPEAVRRLANAVKLAPGEKFTFKTYSTDDPHAPAIESGTVVGQEEREIRGVKRKVWKLTNEVSFLPGIVSNLWVDENNENVESYTAAPGIGEVHEYVTTRAECMKQPEGAEIFSSSVIHPQKAMASPDDFGSVTYRLSLADTQQKLKLWNGPGQWVISSKPGSCEIEVTAPVFTAADADWKLPHADTPELHVFLQPSAYLEIDSPDIQRLAHEAVRNETNPVLAAYRIERFVRMYITKKDLNIGFASAEETAKSREGDCTEHAVLCAALGRAAGLPTRCVVGLGYIPPDVRSPTVSKKDASGMGEFQFHMWAEAWIGPDKWVPMDAAMNGFDVGHIAVNKPTLEEVNPILDVNVPILDLMKSLKVEIVKTVPRSAMPSHEPPLQPEPVASTPAKPDAPSLIPAKRDEPTVAPAAPLAPLPKKTEPMPLPGVD